MKKNGIFIIVFTLFTISLSAQRQAANWYFGEKAGIKFNTDNSVSALSDGEMSTIEGCTTISNDNGVLQMYTDGTFVYNADHDIMQNGSGLKGDQSSSQSAIIVPKPEDSNIYYIFTVGSSQGTLGLNFSEVDMTLDGGLGAVTANKNINLLSSCAEKVSAVLKDCDSGNIWVVGFSNAAGNSASQMKTFHAFEVSSAGVNVTPVSSTQAQSNISELRGNMKFSPDGSKLASANIGSGLYVYDFDLATGIVSNALELPINTGSNKPYGVEFSPNNQLLYAAASNDYFNTSNQNDNNNPANHVSTLVQFDLNAADIPASQIVINQTTAYRSSLQLGPDGKIYRSMSATYLRGLPSLSVINSPNTLGLGCNYQQSAIQLQHQ